MTIRSHAGPHDGAARVGTAYSAMTDGPANLFVAAIPEEVPAAQIGHPIPNYALDLEQLSRSGRAALADARCIAWRYLVVDAAKLSLVEVPEEVESEPELIVSHGLVRNLARTARLAERVAEPDRDYEPRILDLDLIGESVLWMHDGARPDTDLFFSLRPTPHRLKPVALFRRLGAAASRKLAAMATAGSEGGG
jgi:hypothetical protein